jgi:hypothetical protein
MTMTHFAAAQPEQHIKNTSPFIRDDRIDYVCTNLTSLKEASHALTGCNIAVMAASAHTGGASTLIKEPWHQVVDNITMYSHVLEACHYQNIERVIWIGSATLYQEFNGFIKERGIPASIFSAPNHGNIAIPDLMIKNKLGLTYHTTFDFRRSRQAYQEGFALWQQAGQVQPEVSLPPCR